MRVLILGGDGYLGWPTAVGFAARGHDVVAVDNYLRRTLAQQTASEPLLDAPSLPERARILGSRTGVNLSTSIADLNDFETMRKLIIEVEPDVVVHYAEQPSAPYSQMSVEAARLTLNNNLNVTHNLLLAIRENSPNTHLIKLGTMGEYGVPNIDIEEGWLHVEHNGRSDKFLFPRAAGSLYHTTKVLDTDLIWFYVRTFDLRVTDLMQGPVYGVTTDELAGNDDLLPSFHYDDIFGTVVNRFLAQAVAGIPLTVYGTGSQIRGYLNLVDTLACVDIAAQSPPMPGELRILNQFTETFSVLELANMVTEAAGLLGIAVETAPIENPRREAEDHYYNPSNSSLIKMGLSPTLIGPEVLAEMLELVARHRHRIRTDLIMPRVRWS